MNIVWITSGRNYNKIIFIVSGDIEDHQYTFVAPAYAWFGLVICTK